MRLIQSIGEKTVCIGVASWGTMYNRKKLIKLGEAVDYGFSSCLIGKNAREKKAILEKNHTHFLLVDDGYVNKPGAEVDFRKRLENNFGKCANMRQ